ncbi:MAG TPA: DUF2087 domain-containing protein [Rubrivivax sp.]|nr:DUF2087 domain-containing protein [Rubrivivax sp.]
MDTIDTPSSDAALKPWAALVRKQGISLGVLASGQRRQALALVWSLLPQGVGLTEPQVNEGLKSALAGAAACLDTDHVELRRWLVDAGWLHRDGFGREYRVPAWDDLAPELRAAAEPLRNVDMAAWAAGQHKLAAAERALRLGAWQARQGT